MAKSKQTETLLTDAEESALKDQVEKAVGSTTAPEPEKPKIKRTTDPELQAMSRISAILKTMPLMSQRRAIDWVSSRVIHDLNEEERRSWDSYPGKPGA